MIYTMYETWEEQKKELDEEEVLNEEQVRKEIEELNG